MNPETSSEKALVVEKRLRELTKRGLRDSHLKGPMQGLPRCTTDSMTGIVPNGDPLPDLVPYRKRKKEEGGKARMFARSAHLLSTSKIWASGKARQGWSHVQSANGPGPSKSGSWIRSRPTRARWHTFVEERDDYNN